MGKVINNIIRLAKEIEELNPTEKEIFEYDNTILGSFITNNTWQPRRIGHSFHIHIGLKGDIYLDVEKAEVFINWIKERRQKIQTS